MAINPMQRKSRNSFLLGMLVTMILAGGAIAFLIFQMNDINEQLAYSKSGSVYVLSSDVKSGQIITSGMLNLVKVNPNMVPMNSQNIMSVFDGEYLVDQNGNRIYGDSVNGFYYEASDGTQTSIFMGTDNKYYYRSGNTNVEVQIGGAPIIAKIDINANTPLTTDMLTARSELVNKDVRLEEYNMLKLPSTLEAGDYIDVRLTLPSGQDYVVISKKEVKRCDLTTIWIEVSEDEITTMNNAIIESYIMIGSQLYVTRYVEPGLQTAAIPTYPVSQAVSVARANNPNILQEAIDAYNDRVTANNPTQDRNYIEQALLQYAENRLENVENGVEESKEKALETREEFLETLI